MSDLIILEIKDVKGNCETVGHLDHILCYSYSNSLSMQMTSDISNSERTSGRPMWSEMTISKKMDTSTAALYTACAAGDALGDIKLHVGRNQDDAFMPTIVYTMFDAMVTNISTSGGGGDVPMEQVSFNFRKITGEYTKQKPDSSKEGVASFGWDIALNKSA